MEIYPKFIIKKSQDLMIRGRDFYAIWDEEAGLWSTEEQDAVRLIDKELAAYVKEKKNEFGSNVSVLYMWDATSCMIDKWHHYCQKQMRDNYQMLDEKLLFSNSETNKKDYASKRLPYPLEEGSCAAYEKLISTLYSEQDRHKIEWAIGSIVTGESKYVQKFIVLYGSAGTGKSTIMNIIQKLFEGYYSVFDAKALGSSSASFALESFRTNPLVAIQHDGDLSRIEDNTRLNSLVSHELMTVNEKFKATYNNSFKSFLFMGTNRPVKITDGKSGLLRRLIDVSPSGNKIPAKEYKQLVKQVDFELGPIACHCRDVFLEDPGYYDDYVPTSMMGASNDFYNYIIDNYHIFKKEDSTTLKAAWEMYKTYVDEAKVPYPLSRKNFKEELKNYFWDFSEKHTGDNGVIVGYYQRFRTDIFDESDEKKEPEVVKSWLEFKEQSSIFDKVGADYKAQYASKNETPMRAWASVSTVLSSLDTSILHYVKVPINHIIIDFDIPDEKGNKSYEKNMEAVSKWPATYAELSKSGAGIHLHYIYTGDPEKLSRIYDDHIEIKVYVGDSSLRRKLTKCNDLPIASISSGLPLKGDDKVLNITTAKNEKAIRTLLKRNLAKEYHSGTKSSIDFINKILTDAYNDGTHYDVTDMRNAVYAFGANSTNNADYCIKLINKMHFKSEEPSSNIEHADSNIVFFDIECFPNLFLLNWKFAGEDKPVVRMINPKPQEIEELLHYRLIGFNNRNYDNHMVYARYIGYTNEQLYDLSTRLINDDSQISRNAKFGEAYNLSYTDVYDFCSEKMSLKKWEIKLGIHHKELGLPWDQPVAEELWPKVAEYCDNDVIATEAVFNARQEDFLARQILAKIAKGTVNDTTNSLTQKLIFGSNRHPQSEFNYRNLGELSLDDTTDIDDEFTRFNNKNQPVFPGYKYEFGKSTYRDEVVGEGGEVYAKPGMYGTADLLDITSMHPTSAIVEKLFGERFTARFEELVKARVDIKHEDWDELNELMDGALTPFVQDVIDGKMTSASLAGALKIAINSVYGLTSAHFDNCFRDPRNVDNIVAKRGALFMINLRHKVISKGFTVIHIKTDSIKIADATPEIIKFVMDYGKRYGYNFEHEATYERMAIVNDAVYIAKYMDADACMKRLGYIPDKNKKHGNEWTATGTQFQVPYVYKKLFSKEPILFEDMSVTNAVKKGELYLDFNEGRPDVAQYERQLARLKADLRDGESNTNVEQYEQEVRTLEEKIAEGHKYEYIGRVGRFCPMQPGCGAGVLYRYHNNKYYAATGTKGYIWKESEIVKDLGQEGLIDRSYFDSMVDEAVESISKYGNFEWFVSDDPYIPPLYTEDGRPIYTDALPKFNYTGGN